MPTYLYKCSVHGEFEEFHSISICLKHCPECEKTGTVSDVQRLINTQSKGVVELTGAELQSSLQAAGRKLRNEAARNEKVMGNLVGESKYQTVQSFRDKLRRG